MVTITLIVFVLFAILDLNSQVSKLDPQSLHNLFVGYAHHQKDYRCYPPNLGHYIISDKVVFHECNLFHSQFESPPNDFSVVYAQI